MFICFLYILCCKRHLSRAHGDCVDSDLANNVASEPVANVGASVSQPVNVDPPMTVTAHIPIEKRQILDLCSSIIARASLRSS